MPIFVFMTGFQKYRIEARDRAEALHVALTELRPDANAQAVIESTLRDEEEGKRFVSPGDDDSV